MSRSATRNRAFGMMFNWTHFTVFVIALTVSTYFVVNALWQNDEAFAGQGAGVSYGIPNINGQAVWTYTPGTTAALVGLNFWVVITVTFIAGLFACLSYRHIHVNIYIWILWAMIVIGAYSLYGIATGINCSIQIPLTSYTAFCTNTFNWNTVNVDYYLISIGFAGYPFVLIVKKLIP